MQIEVNLWRYYYIIAHYRPTCMARLITVIRKMKAFKSGVLHVFFCRDPQILYSYTSIYNSKQANRASLQICTQVSLTWRPCLDLHSLAVWQHVHRFMILVVSFIRRTGLQVLLHTCIQHIQYGKVGLKMHTIGNLKCYSAGYWNALSYLSVK